MDYAQTMKWWEEHAPTYFTDKVYSFSQPHLIKKLGIQSQHSVLEIGFGYGRELSQFCKLSDHVYGVELFQCTCDLVKDIPATVQTYDGRTLPFTDGMFDVVYSCFVLQHMSRQAARGLLQEAHRVLKRGGRMLMEFYGDPLYQHDVEDKYSGVPGEGGMYNNGFSRMNVDALVLGLGTLEWCEEQPVSVDGRNFYNYWACVKK